MKLAVFGGSGRTGRPLIEQALARGHEVTALVRDPARLPLTHDKLHIVQGDATDLTKVAEVVKGSDAVLNAMGPTRASADNVLQKSTELIIQSMQENGVRRLISLSGAGVTTPKDGPPGIHDRIMMVALTLLARKVLEDSAKSVALIQDSGLDWTVLRLPRLSEDPATGNTALGYEKPGMAPLAREDVARVMLEQLIDTSYIREMPMVRARS